MKKSINEKNAGLLLAVAMTILLLMALLPIFGIKWPWLRYAFAAGAVLTLVAQILTPTPEGNFRVRRLARMNVWSAILYCMSAACLFIPDASMQKSWVAFMLAGAVLQIYATLMLSKLTGK